MSAGRLSLLWATIQLPLQSIALLMVRIALAVPFFRSGLTKWDGFLSLSPSTVFLFENQFKLHIFAWEFSFPFPATMALLSGVGEVVLPLLLVIGLATRLAAAGVLGMTAIIFLTYPSNWPSEALPWSAMAIAIIAFGPGRIAIDRMIAGALAR